MNLHFVRRGDRTTYEFQRDVEANEGELSYRRVDAEVFCRRLTDFGWCVVDSGGDVLSRPFDDAGVGDSPPEGVWVSRKGDRSYVYDLRVVD